MIDIALRHRLLSKLEEEMPPKNSQPYGTTKTSLVTRLARGQADLAGPSVIVGLEMARLVIGRSVEKEKTSDPKLE